MSIPPISGVTHQLLTAVVVLLLGTAPLSADLVKLNNGGELRGKVLSGGPGSAVREEMQIQLVCGIEIVIPRSTVAFVTPRSAMHEEYETRARHVADTVDARWELAEWCRTHSLTKPREEQLREVVRLDPDHEKAHRALGHTFQDGAWVDRDEWMASRGYVKFRGRYVTMQELESLQQTEQQLQDEQAWFPKVRLWMNWTTSGHGERSQQGLANLKNINDPAASAAIQKFLLEHQQPNYRLLGITVLSGLRGPRPAMALARSALFDVDAELRYTATEGISVEDAALVEDFFIRGLRHESNPVVERAGRALALRGSEKAVPALIDALVTKHIYRITVVTNEGAISMGTNGSFASPGVTLPPDVQGMLQTGQLPNGVSVQTPGTPQRTKVVAVEREHQNAEVREALVRLTHQDFGFDERTWRLWNSAEKAGLVK